jgi:aspartyl-tRNA(Asn)/glutamyl-tRNA(Gln) amidotransferase subunit A
MTWSIEDNANVLQAIAGFDARDSATVDRAVPDYTRGLEAGVRGLTIGYVRDIGEAIAVESAVTEGLEDVVAELKLQGATVVDVSLPLPPSRYRELTTLISGTERATVHERDFVEKGHLMGRELREALMMGTAARGVDYVTAQRRRRELADSMDALISRFDAILLPCAYRTATPFSDPDLVKDFQGRSATTAFNISGHPALAMRTGFDDAGLPTGAQLVGRYFDEALVLRIARAYERARDWHTRRPTL